MTTQVAVGCGVGRTRVNGVCVARTTKRQVRRAARRCAVGVTCWLAVWWPPTARGRKRNQQASTDGQSAGAWLCLRKQATPHKKRGRYDDMATAHIARPQRRLIEQACCFFCSVKWRKWHLTQSRHGPVPCAAANY